MNKLYVRYVPYDAVDSSRGFIVSYGIPYTNSMPRNKDSVNVYLFDIEGFYIQNFDIHSSDTIAIDTYGDVPIIFKESYHD